MPPNDASTSSSQNSAWWSVGLAGINVLVIPASFVVMVARFTNPGSDLRSAYLVDRLVTLIPSDSLALLPSCVWATGCLLFHGTSLLLLWKRYRWRGAFWIALLGLIVDLLLMSAALLLLFLACGFAMAGPGCHWLPDR